VRVRTPDADRLHPVLQRAGATVSTEANGAITVSGLAAEQIGDLAAEHGLRLHELTPLTASLEEAFMDLTRESLEFRVAEEHLHEVAPQAPESNR